MSASPGRPAAENEPREPQPDELRLDGPPSTEPVDGCCNDPSHDHNELSGADVAKQLASGHALLTLVLPAAWLAIALVSLGFSTGSLVPLLIGVALGIVQQSLAGILAVLAQRRRADGYLRPGRLVLATLAQEGPRLLAVLAIYWVVTGTDLRSAALWLGLGSVAAIWGFGTVGEARARNLMLQPGDWSQEQVGHALELQRSGRRMTLDRVLGYATAGGWAVGATLLMTSAPIFLAPLGIMVFGTLLMGQVLAAKEPRARAASPLRWVGPILSLLVIVTGIIFTL